MLPQLPNAHIISPESESIIGHSLRNAYKCCLFENNVELFVSRPRMVQWDLMYRRFEKNMDGLVSSGQIIQWREEQNQENFSAFRAKLVFMTLETYFRSLICWCCFQMKIYVTVPAGAHATLDSAKRSSVRAQTHCGAWNAFEG
jgi:hypothetical protein